MKYIDLLTNEDIKYICNAISGKTLKKLFTDSPKEFSKIKRGFRPNSISDIEAVDLAIKNSNKKFLREFIDFIVKNWMSEIENNISEVENNGADHDEAIAVTLIDSYFFDNIKLYFKLAQVEAEDEYILKICNKMVSLEKLRKLDESGKRETLDDYNELINKVQELSLQIESLKVQKTDAEKRSDELDSVNKDAKLQLLECQEKLKKLQDEHRQNIIELEELRERAKHEIIVDAENFKSDEYDFISLCEVLPPNYKGINLIERLADLTEDGELEEFFCDENEPRMFENRDKLYLNEGPRNAGVIGIWMWRAVPNSTNAYKDFIHSRFAPEIKPIEIILFSQASDENSLISVLKEGIKLDILPELAMYSTHVGKGRYIGFLCNARDFEKVSEGYRIRDNLITLDKYDFGRTDIIRLYNDRRFFKKVSIGMPSAIVYVKDAMELIKNIIINRSSWSSFKSAGKTRGEWKLIKGFLEEFEVDSICNEIADTLNCSQSDAAIKLKEFIAVATSYIDGDSIEDKIIEAVISVNENLLERCKSLIRKEWEEENKVTIENMQTEITALDSELCEKKNQLDLVECEKTKFEEEINNFKAELELKEQLARDVENAVTERINEAQKNAADFIAEMMFTYVPTNATTHLFSEQQVLKSRDIYQDSDSEETQVLHIREEYDEDWEMTLDSIEDELIEAGVKGTFARPMAAYMYAAYLTRSNLLLAGPNAEAIANAFSCAVTGRYAKELTCSQFKSANSYKKAECNEGEVIIIEGPFNSEWVSHIPQLISNTEAFYLGVHPFIEDLQIEPKSYFNYMIPVFTDCIVDKAPAKTFTGTQKSENYIEFDLDYSKKDYAKVLSAFHMSPLTKSRVQAIIGNMHDMLGDTNTDYDILFALLPYAHATMQMPLLHEMMKDNDKKKIVISNTMLKYITDIYGDFNE